MKDQPVKIKFSSRKACELKYKVTRMNLLLVAGLTTVNLIFQIANVNAYFFFSAFIPYYVTDWGMFLCGLYPEEYYTDGFEEMILFEKPWFAVFLAVAAAFILLCLLAWFMSRKSRGGWLIFALVLFAIDTAAMLYCEGIHLWMIFEIIFHIWILVSLVFGIISHFMLKKLPPDEEIPSPEDISLNTGSDSEKPITDIPKMPNSFIIRVADKSVKYRVLIRACTTDYDICYRRVKRTDELVINGNVYDEVKSIIGPSNALKAWIDGHYITAVYNGVIKMIIIDGKPIENTVGFSEKNEEYPHPEGIDNPNSVIIRNAQKDIKYRVLLEKHTFNYDVCYRRVKHTNELVINGNVYDELECIAEPPHTLKAWIDGHYIVAGFDGINSYIDVDGKNVAKKIRL